MENFFGRDTWRERRILSEYVEVSANRTHQSRLEQMYPAYIEKPDDRDSIKTKIFEEEGEKFGEGEEKFS